MKLTKQQIETLNDKCHCVDFSGAIRLDCQDCLGTGKATIEIDKEWVECEHCDGKGSDFILHCLMCKGKGKIQKHKVGDEIDICYFCKKLNQEHSRFYDNHNFKSTKLKILSETEDKYKIVMMR